MKEISSTIEYNGKEYKMIFNLNVMQEIQDEYETLGKWGALTDGTALDANGNQIGEPNIKALVFGFTAMMNEAIDIDNEKNGTNEPFLTRKTVSRMISEIGIENVTKNMNQLVIDSTKSDEKNS